VSAELIEGFDRLPALRKDWEALFLSRANEPSTSLEWTSAMVRHHVRPADRCFLVCLRRGDALEAIVPLVARAEAVLGRRVTLLTPLSEQYNTHSDLLLRANDVDTIRAFVSALFRLDVSWDCFRMARLLDGGPLATMLEHCLAEAGHLHHVRDGLPAYNLQLPESFDAYLAQRSAKFRNYLKRVERKLHAAGAVRVLELTDPQAFEPAYEALLQVERSSWKHAHGTAISAIARQTAFYRDFCREALASGRLHLQWLTLESRPVAYNLGYLRTGSYHYLKTSYDSALGPFGPAAYLRARLIASLIGRGVARFDFPGEPYEWETQWTNSIRWRKVITLYRPTVRGRFLALVERLRHRSRGRRTVRHVDPRAATAPPSANQ